MAIDPLYQLKKGRAKLRVLLVGINTYRDRGLTSLRYGVPNCEGIQATLKSGTTQFLDCQIQTLHGLDQSPVTAKEIFDGLNQVLNYTDVKDTVVFYFSGHGVLDSASNQTYLCLSETDLNQLAETAIPLQKILQELTQSTAGKQVVILDVCHSSEILHSQSVETGKEVSSQEVLSQEVLSQEVLSKEKLPTSESSQSGLVSHLSLTLQKELDRYINQGLNQQKSFCALVCTHTGQQFYGVANQPTSVFSYHLIQGLNGEAADDQGRIDADGLSTYLSAFIPAYFQARGIPESRSQTPLCYVRGSQKIFFGLVESPQIQVGDFSQAESILLRRLNQYRDAFGKALEQYYLLDQVTYQPLKELADRLYLSDEERQQIEIEAEHQFKQKQEQKQQRIQTEAESSFKQPLAPYLQPFVHRLHPKNTHPEAPSRRLQSGIGSKPEPLIPHEDESRSGYEPDLWESVQFWESVRPEQPLSRKEHHFSEEDLRWLAKVQQVVELPDDVAADVIKQQLAVNQAAKAKVSPWMGGVAVGWVGQTKQAIATSAHRAQSLFAVRPSYHPKLLGRKKEVVLGILGLASIAILASLTRQHFAGPAKIEPPFSTLESQSIDGFARSTAWVLAKEYEQQKNWKDALAFAIQAENPPSPWIDHLVKQHFDNMDQRYQTTFDANAIAQLRADTRIAMTDLPANSPIRQQMENKAKLYKEEWNRNKKHLVDAQTLINRWNLSGAEAELKKIQLLGKAVPSGSPYWNQKIQPMKNEIARSRMALRSPKRATPSSRGSAAEPTYSPAPSYQEPYSPPAYQEPYSPPSYQEPYSPPAYQEPYSPPAPAQSSDPPPPPSN